MGPTLVVFQISIRGSVSAMFEKHIQKVGWETRVIALMV